MGEAARRRTREASRRRYLMCPPTYFAVDYAINPWMDPNAPVDGGRAVRQWNALRSAIERLGHGVELIDPVPGLPDMVFAANGATVIDGRVLVASFRHPERSGESAAFEKWFRDRGYVTVTAAEYVNEGEGDHLAVGRTVLAGNGFRTERAANEETAGFFGRPVTGLQLVDPRFYHLDTALAVLDGRTVMLWPGAFTAAGRRRVARLFPEELTVQESDAERFGLNVISDGRHVILPAAAERTAGLLAAHGFEPVRVEMDELAKGGGGPKCCVLELGDPTQLSAAA
ncbi:dimethylargininase [Kitasatospora sp. MBT63]|uniref:dimethylargininase n=1 Tax=Kitasatospora sp. MBT63 TaxID=1444768 RepID=UPI000539B5B1|nr:dimethylargininase [Kitasatospora sp. MBT63]